jgi:LysM repeat protein
VQKVADNFGVPPAMVRRWNHLKGDSLKGRSVVYVHLPVTPTSGQEVASTQHSAGQHKKTASARTSGESVVHHKVKQGETLFSIASAYNTTVAALKRNNRNIAVLHPGMVLVIRP